jgi:hypothetical protein
VKVKRVAQVALEAEVIETGTSNKDQYHNVEGRDPLKYVKNHL